REQPGRRAHWRGHQRRGDRPPGRHQADLDNEEAAALRRPEDRRARGRSLRAQRRLRGSGGRGDRRGHGRTGPGRRLPGEVRGRLHCRGGAELEVLPGVHPALTKRMSMAEAVARFVPDGARVAMGTCLEAAIPFAAGHEIVRQRRRRLTLIGPISDSLFDQLIGAGCVEAVCAAWVGNVSEGLGHCYRRAVEHGEPIPIQVYDHSNFSISLALWAAAWGSPYLPTRTLPGSDILT